MLGYPSAGTKTATDVILWTLKCHKYDYQRQCCSDQLWCMVIVNVIIFVMYIYKAISLSEHKYCVVAIHIICNY